MRISRIVPENMLRIRRWVLRASEGDPTELINIWLHCIGSGICIYINIKDSNLKSARSVTSGGLLRLYVPIPLQVSVFILVHAIEITLRKWGGSVDIIDCPRSWSKAVTVGWISGPADSMIVRISWILYTRGILRVMVFFKGAHLAFTLPSVGCWASDGALGHHSPLDWIRSYPVVQKTLSVWQISFTVVE